MDKNVIPAPLDEKNVMTDWIEEIFDDWNCSGDGRNQIVGFVCNLPVYAFWHNNVLQWSFSYAWTKEANDELVKRLRSHEDIDSNLFSEMDFYREESSSDTWHTLVQRFYFHGD